MVLLWEQEEGAYDVINKFPTVTSQPPSRPPPKTRDIGPFPITHDRLAVNGNRRTSGRP